MLCEFQYLAPGSRDELLAVLEKHGPSARILAGGTDLIPNVRSGVVSPEFVVDLKRVPGFDTLEYDKRSGVTIGPAVTINDLVRDDKIAEAYPLLGICGAQLASHQLRNRATVVGNIANASPCADMAPALLCLDASVVIASAKGTRTVPVKDFFTGVKKTVVETGEIIDRIEIPASSAGAAGGYQKLKRIKGHDLGIVGVALLKTKDRIITAVSSAAPTPVLVDAFPAGASVAEVADGTVKAVSPIDDIRASREYRLVMIREFTERLMEEVILK